MVSCVRNRENFSSRAVLGIWWKSPLLPHHRGHRRHGFPSHEASLRAHYTIKRANEALRKLKGEHQETEEKSTAVDLQVSNVMGEVQRLEANHANLVHMMGRLRLQHGAGLQGRFAPGG